MCSSDLLQITLGGVTVWSRRAVLATTTHLVVGAALLATSLTLTLRASQLVGWRGPAHAPAGPGSRAFPITPGGISCLARPVWRRLGDYLALANRGGAEDSGCRPPRARDS